MQVKAFDINSWTSLALHTVNTTASRVPQVMLHLYLLSWESERAMINDYLATVIYC